MSALLIFTFHYGSILIQRKYHQNRHDIIYIPLWFYSNFRNVWNIVKGISIYIPLWFYSNTGLIHHISFSLLIYIPLWFYSNK